MYSPWSTENFFFSPQNPLCKFNVWNKVIILVYGDEVETINLGAVLIEVCVTHSLGKVETSAVQHLNSCILSH